VSPDVPEEAAPEELPELEPVVVVVVDVEVTPVLVVTAVLLLLPEVPSATVPSATVVEDPSDVLLTRDAIMRTYKLHIILQKVYKFEKARMRQSRELVHFLQL